MSKITEVKARQVLDCKGRPVAEVDVVTESGFLGRAGASTGSSVGANESFVLRDGDPGIYGGMSVYKAIANIREVLAPAILGMDVQDQEAIDRKMIDQVGVVGDAPGNGEEVLEESQAAVVAAHPGDGVSEFSCAIHSAFVLSDIDFSFSPNRGCYLAGEWGVGLPSVHVRPGLGRKEQGLTRRLWGFQQIDRLESILKEHNILFPEFWDW